MKNPKYKHAQKRALSSSFLIYNAGICYRLTLKEIRDLDDKPYESIKKITTTKVFMPVVNKHTINVQRLNMLILFISKLCIKIV